MEREKEWAQKLERQLRDTAQRMESAEVEARDEKHQLRTSISELTQEAQTATRRADEAEKEVRTCSPLPPWCPSQRQPTPSPPCVQLAALREEHDEMSQRCMALESEWQRVRRQMDSDLRRNKEEAGRRIADLEDKVGSANLAHAVLKP